MFNGKGQGTDKSFFLWMTNGPNYITHIDISRRARCCSGRKEA
jgi:hypothetical protein